MAASYSWNSHDIDTLRLHFLKGIPIKSIAFSMNRTQASVNKALSRFKIRTPRTLKVSCHTQKKSSSSSRAAPSRDAHASLRHTSVQWTKFEAVLHWMRAHHIEYTQTSHRTFLIQRRPLSRAQVVMYANKLRLEKGEEIFFVEDVTW